MRLIDADAIYPWYMDAFDFDPNDVRFSMNDIRDNLENIPTHPTPSNTLGALDCVSREELTKEIETYFGDLPIAVHYDMLALAQELPSVQPERKKGRWTYHTYMPHKKYCSECGHDSPYDRMWEYCPHCGSYNGGEQDG